MKGFIGFSQYKAWTFEWLLIPAKGLADFEPI
jgi:hypothetical protein